jgi:cell division septal protein FtsQ
MPETNHTEDLNARASAPSASMPSDLIHRPRKGPEVGLDSEADKASGQSVFSSRSGIQDPLVKTLPPAVEPEMPPVPENEESALAPPAEELEPVTPDKRRKDNGSTKPGEKLVKSRRQLDRVRRRQENYLQKRRKEKKLKVFYGRLKLVLQFCFAIVWGVLLWEMAHSSLWIFNAPRFQVENQRLVQASQLAPLVKPWVGIPIYAINTGKLADRIEADFDLVDRAVVRRLLFPARLNVQIFEKKPWAALYVPASYDQRQKQRANDAKASQLAANPKIGSQKLFEETTGFLPYGVVAVDELISLKGYQHQPKLYADMDNILVNPQTSLKSAYLLQLREIAWQARQIKGLHLEALDIRNPERVILRYREIPVILGQLNHSASDRLARLAPLLPKIEAYRDIIEAVDLKWEGQVTFHKKPNAQLKKSQPEKVRG